MIYRITLLSVTLFVVGCSSESTSKPVTTSTATESESVAESELSNAALPSLLVLPDGKNNNSVTLAVNSGQLDWSEFDKTESEQLAKTLTLHLKGGDTTVLGEVSVEEHRMTFRPSFPLVSGETYVAMFDISALGGDGEVVQREFTIPSKDRPAPKIEAVYPSGSIVPANHLKFYLKFSQPMEQGDIYTHFSLRDETANEIVPRPFRHTELWSQDNRELTLWFHPGRQKDGVNLYVEIGPVLNPDHEYSLIVSSDWKSESGVPMGVDFEKQFIAGPKDRTQPDPKSWILSNPSIGTRDILRCNLHEPLDWALMYSAIHVEDVEAPGKPIAGTIEPGYGELSWNFEPEQPWKNGKYRLAIKTIIEDLAGNNLEQPFEVDVSESTEKAKPAKYVYLDFECVTAAE